MIDDIDLGGEVCGVRNVPPQPNLGDTPDAPKPVIAPKHTSSNLVTVYRWEGEPKYVLTLTVSPKVTRQSLSEALQEWRVAHPRIDKVKGYVDTRHPFANLAIFTLQKCGFNRTGVDLVWERDLKRTEPKPEPPAPKPEPKEERWNSWGEELRALNSQEEYCRKNHIIWLAKDKERMNWLEEKIEEREAFRSSPEMKDLDAQIAAAKEAADAHLAELQKGKS